MFLTNHLTFMKTKALLISAVAMVLTVAGAAFATGGTETEVTAPRNALGTHFIPGTLSVTSGWTFSGQKTEANGNVGYVKNGTWASVDFHCNRTGAYNMTWNIQNFSGGTVDILIKDLTTGEPEIEQVWTIVDGTSVIPLEGIITEGDKNLTFTMKADHNTWICNYYSPEFEWVSDTYDYTGIPTGWDAIPGSLPITNWTYTGTLRLENNGGNVGYVVAGDKANHKFFCAEAGVYKMNINFSWFQGNAGYLGITITDRVTRKKEVDTKYYVDNVHNASILLPGFITTGKKDIEFNVITDRGGYIFNWETPVFEKVGDSFATISDVTVLDENVEQVELEGFDMAYNIPLEFGSDNITFNVDYMGATLDVSAGDTEVTQLADGKYSIPVPAPNSETIVTMTLNPDENAYSDKTEYRMRFFRIGGVMLTGLKLNTLDVDSEIVAALNSGNEVNINNYVFTALPEVTATFIDGSTATANVALNGTQATCTFTGKSGNMSKDFSFELSGIYIYTRTSDDKDAKVVYDATYNQADGSWSDGLYTINPCNDGWGGSQFKLKGNSTITLTAPSDMKINQLIFGQLSDNYQPGRIKSVTSEGATVRLPSESNFVKGTNRNLVVNIENHKAGTPFEIEIEGDGQPVTWFEFVYETVVPESAPELVSTSTTSLIGKNHTVVSFVINREVIETDVEFNGATVHGNASGVTLTFPLWDLEYNTEYTFTLPAGSVTDTYGNSNTEPFSCTFTTGMKNDDVVDIDSNRFKMVSDITGLREAVASLYQTNTTPDCETTVIYILNGDYDLGSDLVYNGNEVSSSESSDVCLSLNKLYNVSLIGESQDGVIIHGSRTGISNPIFSTRYSTNIYMENFTLRNDLDFGKTGRIGVGVAHYGGNLDIMKNITLQSQQDTQVTGERGYYLNCTIHGTVDYVCGGGDHFYDRCTFVQEGAGAITAPMTPKSLKHGYVFQNCTITGVGGYTLGRPWDNEPRCFWLNTTMLSLPADNGWGSMGNLITHFFEYNSMDADGNPIDLSKRTNSSTSINKYSPILPEEYAPYFTVRNVLGYTDSWDAESLTAECAAPSVTYTEQSLKWTTVDRAAGYIIYHNGTPLTFTTENEYVFPTPSAAIMKAPYQATDNYSVAAISSNGSRGTISDVVNSGNTTAISTIDLDSTDEIEFYNLQGVKVGPDAKGILIRVSTLSDGSRSAEKTVIK